MTAWLSSYEDKQSLGHGGVLEWTPHANWGTVDPPCQICGGPRPGLFRAKVTHACRRTSFWTVVVSETGQDMDSAVSFVKAIPFLL